MTLEDLKKLATGSLLFSLDRIIAPQLIRILYLLGLVTIGLWAIRHFFSTFGYSFGAGLWGLLEIGIFGLLGFVGLRIACEALIVYFKANEPAAEAASRGRPSVSLIDEVRDAIEELADGDRNAAEDDPAGPEDGESLTATPHRTARRTPPPAPLAD